MSALILPKLGMCKTAKDAVRKLEEMGARVVGSGFYSRVYRVEVYEERQHMLDPYHYRAFNEFFDPARNRMVPIPVPVRPERVGREVRIVKVALSRDPGGLMAANAAMLTKSMDALAPRYFGITDFGDGCWMGELEELTAVGDFGQYLDTQGHPPSTSHLTGGGREPVESLYATSVYLRTLRDMRETYSQQAGKVCYWDIHGDNVMMRGNQPVITDPLSAT